MGRKVKVHARTKNAPDSNVYCGMDKSGKFEIQSVGPKAKGATCNKCIKKRDKALAAKTAAAE